MTDLAVLGLRFETQGAVQAEAHMEGLADAAGHVEQSTRRAERATASLSDAARHGSSASATLARSMMDQQRVLAATRGAMGLTAHEGLNMGRQMSDVGVQMAMGMSPFLIAVQQGPQIFDVFQQAALRAGTSIRSAMVATGAAVWAAMAPLLPFIAAAAAAAAIIGGGLALATRELNKENSDLAAGLGLTEDQMEKVKNKGVTMGDVLVGTFNYVKDIIWSVLGPSITKIGDWFSEAMDKATTLSVQAIKVIVGGFLGGFRAVKAVWSSLPAVIGDLAISAANGAIRAVEWMINKAVTGINVVISAAKQLAAVNPAFASARGLSLLTPVDLAEMANANAGAARTAGATIAREFAGGMADASGIVDRQLAAIAGSIEDAGRSRIRREAGDADQARNSATGGAGVRAANDNAKLIDNNPLRDQLEMLRLERSLIGASNLERAVSIALLAKRHELARAGFTAESEGYAEAIRLAADAARMQVEGAEALNAYNLGLEYQVDFLRQIENQARSAAQGLSDAFGAPGQALGDLLTGMSGLNTRLAEITEAERRYRKEVGESGVEQRRLAMFAQDRAQAQVDAYGNMIGAAQGFFKEGSDGYQALQAAEQAYRVYQFAMSVQAMMMGGQETAFTVGQNMIRAASHGVVAVARALASLPFPFNLAAGAATLAALVAIGVKLTGGGGGGGGGSRGTYNPASINSRDESIATARGQATSAQAGGASLTERLAQQIKVKIELNDPMFRARVQQETAPMVQVGSQMSVAASRKAVPADRARADAFKMGGRGR